MSFFDQIQHINWLSVVSVTILSFPLGTLWHSQWFSKAWKEDARPVFDKSNRLHLIRLFGFTALAHFVMFAGLDMFIGFGASWLDGLYGGFFVSLIWMGGALSVTHAFVGRPVRLIFIDTGFYILLFSLAGAILGAWH